VAIAEAPIERVSSVRRVRRAAAGAAFQQRRPVDLGEGSQVRVGGGIGQMTEGRAEAAGLTGASSGNEPQQRNTRVKLQQKNGSRDRARHRTEA
jgi:hypothetical protein